MKNNSCTSALEAVSLIKDNEYVIKVFGNRYAESAAFNINETIWTQAQITLN